MSTEKTEKEVNEALESSKNIIHRAEVALMSLTSTAAMMRGSTLTRTDSEGKTAVNSLIDAAIHGTDTLSQLVRTAKGIEDEKTREMMLDNIFHQADSLQHMFTDLRELEGKAEKIILSYIRNQQRKAGIKPEQRKDFVAKLTADMMNELSPENQEKARKDMEDLVKENFSNIINHLNDMQKAQAKLDKLAAKHAPQQKETKEIKETKETWLQWLARGVKAFFYWLGSMLYMPVTLLSSLWNKKEVKKENVALIKDGEAREIVETKPEVKTEEKHVGTHQETKEAGTKEPPRVEPGFVQKQKEALKEKKPVPKTTVEHTGPSVKDRAAAHGKKDDTKPQKQKIDTGIDFAARRAEAERSGPFARPKAAAKPVETKVEKLGGDHKKAQTNLGAFLSNKKFESEKKETTKPEPGKLELTEEHKKLGGFFANRKPPEETQPKNEVKPESPKNK